MPSSIQRMLGGAALAATGLAVTCGLLAPGTAGHTEPVAVESPGGSANGSSLATITHAVTRWTTVDGWTDPDGAWVSPR